MNQIEISVIIPVYNDPEGLRDTLESLVDQEFDGSYEVLPVDNNSTDNTGQVIEEFEDKYPDQVRGLEENEVQSSYAARNTGIKKAEGDILVFTDADMWWENDVLSIVSREFENTDVDYLGGKVNTVETESNIYSKFGSRGFGNEAEKLKSEKYVPTAFLAIDRSILDKVTGFDERMSTGADRVFGKRVSEEGFNQSFCDEIDVYHPARSSFSSLLGRKAKYGRSIHQMEKFNPEYIDDSTRHPLHPKNMVPTLPWRLKNLEMDVNSLSNIKKTQLYFLYWLDKLYYIKGYIEAKYF